MRAVASAIALVAVGFVPLMLGCETGPNICVPGDGGGADVSLVDGVGADSTKMDASGATSDAPKADVTTSEAASDAPAPIADASRDAVMTTDATGTGSFAAMRVANWSPDAPAVDFCLALHSTNDFQGPVLAARAVGGQLGAEAGAAGLAFPQVSSYSLVKPVQYDVRLVVAGSGGCSAPLISDATTLPAPAAGSSVTLAFVGEVNPTRGDGGDPGLQVHWFTDDSVAPAGAGGSASVALRFIHAAPGLVAVDFGTGSGGSFQALLSRVKFVQDPATAMAAVPDGGQRFDSNGYWVRGPLVSETLSTHPSSFGQDSGATPETVAPSVSAAAGSLLTIALVGSPSTGTPIRLLECVDNAGTTTLYSTCSAISP
jgi:uncharacterized protein DUF4397